MQLLLEDAWERTVSPQDRQLIEATFNKTKNGSEARVLLRTAVNHHGQLLVLMLNHNFSDETLIFDNTFIEFENHAQYFTIPKLVIPPRTSMPWTFIFD